MAWKQKSGKKWTVRWRHPITGAPRSKGGHPTARAATDFITVVEALNAQGLDWEPPALPEQAALVTALNAYLDHVELTKSKGTTYNRTISLELFRRFVEETTPAASLNVLTKTLLTGFLAWLKLPANSQRKAGRSSDFTRKCVEHVQGFWAWAADDDAFVDKTPRPRRLAELRGLRSPRTPTRAPTWADMDAMIAALGVQPAGQRVQRDFAFHILSAVIQRCTGLRVSQVDRLIVGDVDVALGVLTFRGELGKSHQERAGRLLPIAPPLLPVLRRMTGHREPAELLVARIGNPAGSNSRERMAEAWTLAKVPPAVWKQRPNHALRKGFSSELARSGISKEVRDFLTGHSAGIAGFYTDPDALDLRGAVDKVAPFAPAAWVVIDGALSTTNAVSFLEHTRGTP